MVNRIITNINYFISQFIYFIYQMNSHTAHCNTFQSPSIPTTNDLHMMRFMSKSTSWSVSLSSLCMTIITVFRRILFQHGILKSKVRITLLRYSHGVCGPSWDTFFAVHETKQLNSLVDIHCISEQRCCFVIGLLPPSPCVNGNKPYRLLHSNAPCEFV